MVIASLVLFLLLIAGIYNILNLSASQMGKDISQLANKEKTISKKALLAQGKTRESKIEKAIQEIQLALKITNKQDRFATVCCATIILFFTGILLAILIKNYLLMPIFAIILCLIPFVYVKSTLMTFNKEIKKELETALSITLL